MCGCVFLSLFCDIVLCVFLSFENHLTELLSSVYEHMNGTEIYYALDILYTVYHHTQQTFIKLLAVT